jgi:uncharacterized RDD family membrane protein YckC
MPAYERVDYDFINIIKRQVAFVIDLVIPFALIGTLAPLIGLSGDAIPALCWLGWIIYGTEAVHQYGSTVGQRLMGWRLVRRDNSEASFIRIFLRLVVFLFSFTGIGTLIAIGYGLFKGELLWWDYVTDTKFIKAETTTKTK